MTTVDQWRVRDHRGTDHVYEDPRQALVAALEMATTDYPTTVIQPDGQHFLIMRRTAKVILTAQRVL